MVVAVTLLVVGAVVVAMLSSGLVQREELTAEVTARSIAGQLAAGTPPSLLDLDDDDDDELVQVVDQSGTVVAASPVLADLPRLLSEEETANTRTEPGSAPPTDDDDDDDDDDDWDDDDDDAPSPSQGRIHSPVYLTTITVPGQSDQFRFAAMTATTPTGEEYGVYAGSSLGAQQETIDQLTTSMLLALPAVLLVVAMVTWLVTGRALRPVADIRAELAEITAGDLSRRVPVPRSHDEIHDLATTTNKTLTALETSVTQQRRFIADASHELRSPLAILRAQLEVATNHPQLLDLPATLSDVIRLQSLATDLLLLARLDVGERPPGQRIDFTDLIREEVARRAATDRLPVRLELADDVTVMGVRGHLVRLLVNLVDNAQHHARGGVWVSLEIEPRGGVLLRVADDGSGIPPADRERVFNRFVRLDESRSRDEGGAGLGLAIVHDVVTAHGGSIRVVDSVHGGAEFQVWLPGAGSDGGPVTGGLSG
ncbi:signal transduction histidine kinase [Stackebrandtia endophytica]|uniref:histidine kinase n=1 Tax=Stackebrandtia endophytica TaxID=1496996 RepID=A0A543B2Q8_9ACTN|nr:HAMP domain-containing sensor histidine kinase [Stackebrandtia endophytica]TQL79102.1 signal transduction histidine kinase [Stackebrandtia endophytica]